LEKFLYICFINLLIMAKEKASKQELSQETKAAVEEGNKIREQLTGGKSQEKKGVAADKKAANKEEQVDRKAAGEQERADRKDAQKKEVEDRKAQESSSTTSSSTASAGPANSDGQTV
jgi:hypothetical protein